jgi:hypothetical protein
MKLTVKRVVIIVITVFFVKACMDSPQESSFSPRAPADPEMGQPKYEGTSQPQYA